MRPPIRPTGARCGGTSPARRSPPRTWSLDGKESEGNAGDILYVEPWVYHGLTNTGQEKLIFAVIRYNGKGVDIPPRPDDRPDEL